MRSAIVGACKYSPFFLSWHEVCGIFIKLNINERYTYSITIGWNFGLLSRLMQNIGNFFPPLDTLLLSVWPIVWIFQPTFFLSIFSLFLFFLWLPRAMWRRVHRAKHSHPQISVSLNINESICANGDFYDQRRYLPVLPFIHESTCQIQCVHCVCVLCLLCYLRASSLLLLHLHTVNLLFPKKNVRTNSDSVGKNHFQNVENRWHTAVKAASKHEMTLAMQWRWQERQKNTRTHTHSP